MTIEPAYQSPAVNVAASLPKRSASSAVLLVPVVSTGEEEKPGAVVVAAEPFLTADAVAEIEAGLKALEATGASEQVHRLVVPSLPVASVLTIGLGKPRPEWPASISATAPAVRNGSAATTTAPGFSSSPVETTGTSNTAELALRLGSNAATLTAGDW